MGTFNEILNNPFVNKGTAFSMAEREKLNLVGLLPPVVQTLEEQIERTYLEYQKKVNNLEKRVYLMTLFNTNRTLFYALMAQHIEEFMPIVYDPVVADAIRQYDELFMKPQDAGFLSIDHPEDIEKSLRNASEGREIKLIVVTDAEAILGIGDWGVNGVAIAIGKLMVYTAAAGINPNEVLPLVLDVGTDNKQLLDNPLYLGNRHERVRGKRYHEFVDKIVETAERTGIVALAGILGALNISKQKFTNQCVMVFGAGTAGAGIAHQIYEEFMQQGLSSDEAKQHIYLVDKQGLLTDDMTDLTEGQQFFARSTSDLQVPQPTLLAAVRAIRPTILIGTSTCPGAFTEEIVKEMAAHTERPIIFPLSNPTELAEAKASNLIEWTDGRALVATGIPSSPVNYKGVTYTIGQANNALMYPGLGLGVIASTAKLVDQSLLSAAAHALGGIVNASQPGAAVLPPVNKITSFSQHLAEVVAQYAIDHQNTRENITDARAAVERIKWYPSYE